MRCSPGQGYAAVLCDVVGSRRHPDRAVLQAAVRAAAQAVNERIRALDPLTATVGDELQATYHDPVTALRAVVHLRLELMGVVQIRAGVGWGDIVIHDPDRSPFGQDGPAWWLARKALDDIAAANSRSTKAAAMALAVDVGGDDDPAATGERAHPESGGKPLPPPQPFRVDAVGLLQSEFALFDQALARLDATEAAIVVADLDGVSTRTIAERLGVGPSAVSQRRHRNHLPELVAALRHLEGAP